jgi:CubicO group peptidase (beta-lactamase class C family)/pimeloyl-ACP methyl ester carboxylesterase
MKFIRKIVFGYMSLMLSWLSGTGQQKAKTPLYDFSYLDRKISGWVDSGFYKGASVVIVRDNQVIHQQYFGNYRPETVAYIASAGKWLAAATIAAVVDEGNLSWNDPVKKWIPEFEGGNKGEATLRQLLSHTAGYPDYQPRNKHADNYQTLKESVSQIVGLPADSIAGTKFKYGGLAMQVAGRMAELASGKDWETLFQEKIARPLQMDSTHFTPVDATPGHSPMLGGGARTKLQDYANFLNMISNDGLFKGKRILSVKAIKEMQADQVGAAKVFPAEFVENVRASRRKDIYGLGEWREEVNVNGDPVLISSPGWAGAYPWIDKKNHVYGFLLARVAEMKNGFSSFLGSPVLPYLVQDVLEQAAHPEVKHGYIITADKSRLYYEESGKGQPLIFIHGHSFDRTEWDLQFFAFAKKYRVIRYDLRGYGWSSLPAETQQALHADDLADLMNQLKITKAHIVGLSLGGFIVSDFLALYPKRILTATVASGDFFPVAGPSKPWTKEEWEAQNIKIKNWRLKGVDAMKREWFDALTIRKGQVIEVIRQPVWKMIYKWDAWQPQHHEPRFLLGNDLASKLQAQKVTVPVMVLTGDADAGQENKLLKAIPSARQVFIKNAGHVSNLENAEGFNLALQTFLAGSK